MAPNIKKKLGKPCVNFAMLAHFLLILVHVFACQVIFRILRQGCVSLANLVRRFNHNTIAQVVLM